MPDIIPQESIETKIWTIRGKRVMLDRDLAALYEVETGHLKRAVRRNIDRFPEDFMFELSKEELEILRCQFGISSWGGQRYLPFAFTDYGVAMLSGVLNSDRAIKINIQIMRAFTRLRQMVADHSDIRKTITTLERRLNIHDRQIQIAFDALKGLLKPKQEPITLPEKEYSPDEKRKMGFTVSKK